MKLPFCATEFLFCVSILVSWKKRSNRMYKVFLFIESVFFLQYGRDENTVSDSCSTGWSTRLFLFLYISRATRTTYAISYVYIFMGYGIGWKGFVCDRYP